MDALFPESARERLCLPSAPKRAPRRAAVRGRFPQRLVWLTVAGTTGLGCSGPGGGATRGQCGVLLMSLDTSIERPCGGGTGAGFEGGRSVGNEKVGLFW